MRGEFLLEIGTEEIPAGFIPNALPALEQLFKQTLDTALIGYGDVTTYATPRRLILCANGVDAGGRSKEVQRTGPPKANAYDEQGNPTKAAIGFAKSQGVDVSELILVQTPRGEQVAVKKVEEGRPTIEVLSEALPSLLEKIPFPKTMRWMDLDVRFARPVHWIVAVFETEVVPFVFGDVQSGDRSFGHRFTHPRGFKVSSFKQLSGKLRSQGILINPIERRKTISEEVSALAEEQGLVALEDTELLDEVAFLVESPYPVMGKFAREFLELPASILITCMKKHQRYFAVQSNDGRITNRFIAVNNTPVKDPHVSIKGHERVLKARLEDARFYFREDRSTPLINRLEALKGVVFHSKLGTSYEKVNRFTRLAVELAKVLAPDQALYVERAALLSKCDLETGIVYEFPELQGIIGSYYADMDGEPEPVAIAIREHYLPAYAGDKLPEGIIGALVSIADRIDTICGCFAVGLIPTGAADPYALRRHALGIIQILISLEHSLDLEALVQQALDLLEDKRTRPRPEIQADVMDFIRTRFVNFHTSRDYPLDVVEAAVRARFDDVVDARKRVDALRKWKERSDFDAIMIGFKRVVNILKGTSPSRVDRELLIEDAEKALYQAFNQVKERARPFIDQGDYFKALEVMAELKGPIDSLFDHVMVMVEDERLRNNRLGLLRHIADFFEQIADFSFIGSTAE
ncbi:MAG: glycine--tRNA ligase subunit beta [Thermodesulfobacteriota bacterium]